MKNALRYWKGWSLTVGVLVMTIMLPAFAGVDGDWTLSGNTLTGVEKLGASNSMPLLFIINNKRVLEISPATAGTNTPKIRAGHPSNTVTADGATVSGGGYASYPNQATQLYATVGGGAGNTASALQSTVSGGYRNTASGERSVVGGGVVNTASGLRSTVGGGSYNEARGNYSTVAGGGPLNPQDPTVSNNKATDSYCTVGGGGFSVAGSDDLDTENDAFATVAGGYHNWASSAYATVAGGNMNFAENDMATVGGGVTNQCAGLCATIGGGRGNYAYGDYATISGGGPDPADGASGWNTNNRASDNYCTVGGGYFNRSGDCDGDIATAPYATVSGGRENTASADSAAVGGGWWNRATAAFATVAGGGADLVIGKAGVKDYYLSNRATDKYCTVGGGGANLAGNDNAEPADANYATVAGGAFNSADHFAATVGGGYVNSVIANYATVGGGNGNTAGGQFSTVPGGAGNMASGSYSLAAGRYAQGTASGTFTWADSTNATFPNGVTNRFSARASGGVCFYTNAGLTTGVYMNGGDSGWTVVSDRNAKENITPVDGREVLAKVASVPISTWNYKDSESKLRHMGPMAQDLHAAFGLGDNDKGINSIDVDGIALAAIQGLHQQNRDESAEIKALKEQVRDLATQVETLKALVQQRTKP